MRGKLLAALCWAVVFSAAGLAAVGILLAGWKAQRTQTTASFPDSLFCGRLGPIDGFFGGACQVPSKGAYALVVAVVTVPLLAYAATVYRTRRQQRALG